MLVPERITFFFFRPVPIFFFLLFRLVLALVFDRCRIYFVFVRIVPVRCKCSGLFDTRALFLSPIVVCDNSLFLCIDEVLYLYICLVFCDFVYDNSLSLFSLCLSLSLLGVCV